MEMKKNQMTDCETFRKNKYVLWDKNPEPALYEACREHLENCPACRSEYEELHVVTDMLTPRHAPQPRSESGLLSFGQSARNRWRYRLLQVAAAVVLFLAGVGVGLSRFFATDVRAVRPYEEVFARSLNSLRCTGNFVMNLRVRTTPDENFAHWDSGLPFLDVKVQHLVQDGTPVWRIAKAGGRTVVFDGSDQYMWYGTTFLKESAEAGFVEDFGLLLRPDRLLEKEQELAATSPGSLINRTETDTTIVVRLFLNGEEMEEDGIRTVRYEVENVFSKYDVLLRGIRVWAEQNGRRTLIVQSSDIRYNVALMRDEVVRLPVVPSEGWHSGDGGIGQLSRKELKALRNEKAEVAAERILTALVRQKVAEVRVSLSAFSEAELQRMVEALKGCSVSDFGKPVRSKSYAGVYVMYTLTRPDGTTERRHVALRNDNERRVWIVDSRL